MTTTTIGDGYLYKFKQPDDEYQLYLLLVRTTVTPAVIVSCAKLSHRLYMQDVNHRGYKPKYFSKLTNPQADLS